MSPYKVESDSGELPAGEHDVEITGVKDKISSKGNPMWIVQMQDAEGRVVVDFIALVPTLQWRIQDLWVSAGLDWPTVGEEVDETQLIGRRVHAAVEISSYNGADRPKVVAYAPPQEQMSLPDGGETGISFADLAQPAAGDESDVPWREGEEP
jgi:hypothetical protein